MRTLFFFLFFLIPSFVFADSSTRPAVVASPSKKKDVNSLPKSAPLREKKIPRLKESSNLPQLDKMIQKKQAKEVDDLIKEKGLLSFLFFLFMGGFLVSLTPCVYPMIPITIAVIGGSAGENEEPTRLRSFLMASTYVLGMCLPYSLLGAAVALAGKQFIVLGGIFNNSFFLLFLIVLFTLMGSSMFGAFDLTLPVALQNKLANVQGKSRGKGFFGIFLLGMIGALLATPCSGPVVVSLLAFIAQKGNPIIGFLLCFLFSLGIGVPFLVLGAGVVSALPRSGVWMLEVKKILGLTLFGAAFFYAQYLLLSYKEVYQLILGTFLIFLSVFSGAFLSLEKNEWWWNQAKKAFGIVCFLMGIYLFAGTLLSRGFLLPPFQKWFPAMEHSVPTTQTKTTLTKDTTTSEEKACLPPEGFTNQKPFWFTDEKQGVRCAKLLKKPYIIDFWAEWCSSCKQLEKESFQHPEVIAESKRFVMIKIVYSEDTVEGKYLRKKYSIRGLPWVRFVTPQGNILLDPLLVGFVKHDALLKLMKKVR